MDANNIIFQMPFDESNGSKVAFDYSQTRADGVVQGAAFVAGKNGNAISFGGKDTCDVSKSVLPNMNVDFSMMMWMQSRDVECGSPQKIGYLTLME